MDIFYLVDTKGEFIGQLSFDMIVVMENPQMPKIMFKTDEAWEEGTLLLFEINGDRNATRLFEFFAGSRGTSQIEWDNVKIGEANEDKSIVGTMHKKRATGVADYLFQNGEIIRKATHNHPEGTSPSKADDKLAAKIRQKYPMAEFNVYVHKYNQKVYFPY